MTELQVTIRNLEDTIIAAGTTLRTLKKAQKDLEAPHKWEHGDVYKTLRGNIMIYLKYTSKPPQTVCVVGICGGLVNPINFSWVTETGEFLFNIKEKI